MFDQPIIRVCLVLGSLITATYILRRVRLAKVQIEDAIFLIESTMFRSHCNR